MHAKRARVPGGRGPVLLAFLLAVTAGCRARAQDAGEWYFLLPPVGHGGTTVRTGAPLWRWEQVEAFPALDACEAQRLSLVTHANETGKQEGLDPAGIAARAARLGQGQCVARADPGLTPPPRAAPVRLLAPPRDPRSRQPDPAAPLGAWKLLKVYDFSEMCEEGRDDLVWELRQQPDADQAVLATTEASRCVPASDLRAAPAR